MVGERWYAGKLQDNMADPSPLFTYLQQITERVDLTAEDAEGAMGVLLRGEASAVEIAAFLVALRTKGEAAAEIAGFARGMRAQMIAVDGGDVVDNCGTGGDGAGTFNISTTAAFVMAGAGARVAKHGNRSISSQTGAADVLEALRVPLTSTREDAVELLNEVGIAFLFAPAFHPAVRHVQPVRRELRLRTVFNLLGPLANPARAHRQVVGAPTVASASLLADALAILGTTRAFVVHGCGGLDEVSLAGTTEVFEVADGRVSRMRWEPSDFGVVATGVESLRGGDATTNAAIVEAVLGGEQGPRRDVVLMNAAAGLLAAGVATSVIDGMRRAGESIDAGAAMAKLRGLQGRWRS
jgi:anthranilate phosphoribosyltransferase